MRSDSGREVVHVLRSLAEVAPTRLTGGPGELALQRAVAARLERSGYVCEWQPFRYSRSVYGSLALHGGLALVFAALAPSWPLCAALGLTLVALSLYSELVWREPILRRLWPRVATQNLLLTRPAEGKLERRLVFVAHADSAYTGLLFAPRLLKTLAKPPPPSLAFLSKTLRLPWLAMIALAVASLASLYVSVPSGLFVALSLPPLILFLFNAEVVLRNEVVPGAADNLTGCAAQVVLAEEWVQAPLSSVEVVFVFSGAEETGAGGAAALAKSCRKRWDPAITDVIVLDTLSNGELYALEEGELFRRAIPQPLLGALRRAARASGRAVPEPYIMPAGATDALPFLLQGYRAVTLTCIDPELHAARHYHRPTDTVDNVDEQQLVASLALVRDLMAVLAGESCLTASERKTASAGDAPALPRAS